MAEDKQKSVFIINEDGSITRSIAAISDDRRASEPFLSRPSIMKFYVSQEEARCGDTIHVAWATSDAGEVLITINQGGRTASEVMPTEGEFNIKSSLSDEDIDITILAKNDIGNTSSRKTVIMSKRENNVETNVGATVLQVVAYLLIIIGIVLKLFT